MFQTKVVEKIKTRILCSVTLPLPSPPQKKYHAVYEIMWKTFVGPERPQTSIWRLRISCWINKATNTLSECIILIAFPLQQWFLERTSVLRCTTSPLFLYERNCNVMAGFIMPQYVLMFVYGFRLKHNIYIYIYINALMKYQLNQGYMFRP